MVLETIVAQAILDSIKEKIDLFSSVSTSTPNAIPVDHGSIGSVGFHDHNHFVLADASSEAPKDCPSFNGCPGAYDTAKTEWHCCPVQDPATKISALAHTPATDASPWIWSSDPLSSYQAGTESGWAGWAPSSAVTDTQQLAASKISVIEQTHPLVTCDPTESVSVFSSPGDNCCDPWCTAYCQKPYADAISVPTLHPSSALAGTGAETNSVGLSSVTIDGNTTDCAPYHLYDRDWTICQAVTDKPGNEVFVDIKGSVSGIPATPIVVTAAAGGAIAAPLPTCFDGGEGDCKPQKKKPVGVRPSAGHLVLAAEAAAVGAVSATAALWKDIRAGDDPSDAAGRWGRRFRAAAHEAAAAVTPVGAYVLQHHVFAHRAQADAAASAAEASAAQPVEA